MRFAKYILVIAIFCMGAFTVMTMQEKEPHKFRLQKLSGKARGKPSLYRVTILSAKLYPSKDKGSCWDVCSPSSQKKMEYLSERLRFAGPKGWQYTIKHPSISKQIKGKKLPDVFVEFSLDGRDVYRTSLKKNTLEPQWTRSWDLNLYPKQDIEFYVWDKDMITSDKIGNHAVTIPSKIMKDGGTWKVSFGQVYELTLLIAPLQKIKKPKPLAFPTGKYKVSVVKAIIKPKNSKKKNWDMMGGKPDPYAIITIGKHTIKTKHVKDTLMPTWKTTKILHLTGDEKVTYKVFDRDLQKDDMIASCSISPLKGVTLQKNEFFHGGCEQLTKIIIQFKRIQ